MAAMSHPSVSPFPDTPSKEAVLSAITSFGKEGCHPSALWKAFPDLLSAGQASANRVVRHLIDVEEVATTSQWRLYVPDRKDPLRIET
jgi:hypothetical protein